MTIRTQRPPWRYNSSAAANTRRHTVTTVWLLHLQVIRCWDEGVAQMAVGEQAMTAIASSGRFGSAVVSPCYRADADVPIFTMLGDSRVSAVLCLWR